MSLFTRYLVKIFNRSSAMLKNFASYRIKVIYKNSNHTFQNSL